MSRIGNKHILIPAGVTVEINGQTVKVKGPKGELERDVHALMKVEVKDGHVIVTRPNDQIRSRQLHGTTRALIANMVHGVNETFTKKLEIHGVGYRAQVQGSKLILTMGYSHPVEMEVPKGINVSVEKNVNLTISGIDKQAVGEFAAKVRLVRKPEPYKGKGIRYEGEHVRRKAGKTAK